MNLARFVLLDAGVIGLLISPPSLPAVAEAKAWSEATLMRHHTVSPPGQATRVVAEFVVLKP